MFIGDLFNKKQLNESLRPGEYVTYEVFFDDGSKETLNFSGDDIDWDRVGSKRNKKVVDVKQIGGIRSDDYNPPSRPHQWHDDSVARAQRAYDKKYTESVAEGAANVPWNAVVEAIVYDQFDTLMDRYGLTFDDIEHIVRQHGFSSTDEVKAKYGQDLEEAYDTSEGNREYFDNVQEWAQAVLDFGGEVVKARDVYVAHGWEGEAGEFDPVAGEGWLVSKVMREGAETSGNKVSYNGRVIGHIATDLDGDPMGVVYDGDNRPYEIYGYNDLDELKNEMIHVYMERVQRGVAEGSETHKYEVVVKGHKRSYSVWVDAKNEEVAIIRAQQYVAREHNDTAKRAAVVDMKKGVAEGIKSKAAAAALAGALATSPAQGAVVITPNIGSQYQNIKRDQEKREQEKKKKDQEKKQQTKEGVAEGLKFHGGFPDVDHMPGAVHRNADMATDNVKTNDKEHWDRAVDLINARIFDDMAEFRTDSKGERVTGNSAVWAVWNNETQTGWFNAKGRPLKPWPMKEAGPFSYGAKKPRKGSVADLAAKKRKEQERGRQPIEPRDQMVGVAKVLPKDVTEGFEELDAYMAAKRAPKPKGDAGVKKGVYGTPDRKRGRPRGPAGGSGSAAPSNRDFGRPRSIPRAVPLGIDDYDAISRREVDEDVEQHLEEMRRAGYDIVTEAATLCPECGGPAYEDKMLAEKQDACYHKVKSRYKVWPSAYASGALVRCRKVGAKNWGNKSKK